MVHRQSFQLSIKAKSVFSLKRKHLNYCARQNPRQAKRESVEPLDHTVLFTELMGLKCRVVINKRKSSFLFREKRRMLPHPKPRLHHSFLKLSLLRLPETSHYYAYMSAMTCVHCICYCFTHSLYQFVFWLCSFTPVMPHLSAVGRLIWFIAGVRALLVLCTVAFLSNYLYSMSHPALVFKTHR